MVATERTGSYFEDFEVGQSFASPGRTVTEADIVNFAGLSGDYNPLHTDAEYARSTPFGQRVAHGLLGLALASGLAMRAGLTEGHVQAFTGLEWKFKSPVFVGDTLYLEARVTKTRPLPSMGGGMVELAVTVANQRGEVVQQGDWSLLMVGRPA